MSPTTRNLLAAAALVTAAGTAAPIPGNHNAAVLDDIVAITFAPEIAELMELPFPKGCTQVCSDCEFKSQHAAESGSTYMSSGAHTPGRHECESPSGHGYCADGTHEPCFAIQDDAEAQARQAVFAALSEGDPGALASVLAAYPEVVSLNRERSAIQVVSCTGGIFAHLPVRVTYRTAQ